ncbi:MAG: type I-E CRISPR-associated protein Cas6/Cse3/CasE [Betaproteobacteria bacterium]|nr:type I-E CRISPR-associated protein Cas6/Cse3/CasE [Betaproteobacteria bacterium]
MNAFMARLLIPSRYGDYRVHQRVYEIAPDRPVFRRFSDHVLVVSRTRPAADQVKRYAPLLREGDLFCFSLYASVEKRRENIGYDPVMRLRACSPERSTAECAEAVADEWLLAKGSRHGWQCTALTAVEYAPLSVVRPSDRMAIRHAALRLEGRLQVTDPASFAIALYHGIGRGRAWGLGLLLIKR